MGIVAILAMRLVPFEQVFNLPLPGCRIWNLIEIGLVVSEKKLFEKVDDADDAKDMPDADDTDDGSLSIL